MKKWYFILAIFSSLFAKAQIYTGGNASVSVANNNLYVDIAPIIGYRINKLNLGASPVLSYRKPQNYNETYSYGGRIFTQYIVFQGFFLHAEGEALNVEDFINLTPENESTRSWIFAVPVGAGYNQSLGDRVTLQAMILYNLIDDERSPYQNPIIRGGINYNF